MHTNLPLADVRVLKLDGAFVGMRCNAFSTHNMCGMCV